MATPVVCTSCEGTGYNVPVAASLRYGACTVCRGSGVTPPMRLHVHLAEISLNVASLQADVEKCLNRLRKILDKLEIEP